MCASAVRIFGELFGLLDFWFSRCWLGLVFWVVLFWGFCVFGDGGVGREEEGGISMNTRNLFVLKFSIV